MEWERDFEDCSYVLFWHMITSPWYSALWKNIPWTIPQSSYISLSSHSNIYFTLWYLHIFHRIYSHYHYKISISSISDISTLQHSILYSHSIFPFYIPIDHDICYMIPIFILFRSLFPCYDHDIPTCPNRQTAARLWFSVIQTRPEAAMALETASSAPRPDTFGMNCGENRWRYVYRL